MTCLSIYLYVSKFTVSYNLEANQLNCNANQVTVYMMGKYAETLS